MPSNLLDSYYNGDSTALHLVEAPMRTVNACGLASGTAIHNDVRSMLINHERHTASTDRRWKGVVLS